MRGDAKRLRWFLLPSEAQRMLLHPDDDNIKGFSVDPPFTVRDYSEFYEHKLKKKRNRKVRIEHPKGSFMSNLRVKDNELLLDILEGGSEWEPRKKRRQHKHKTHGHGLHKRISHRHSSDEDEEEEEEDKHEIEDNDGEKEVDEETVYDAFRTGSPLYSTVSKMMSSEEEEESSKKGKEKKKHLYAKKSTSSSSSTSGHYSKKGSHSNDSGRSRAASENEDLGVQSPRPLWLKAGFMGSTGSLHHTN